MNQNSCTHKWDNIVIDNGLMIYRCPVCGETRAITEKYINSLFDGIVIESTDTEFDYTTNTDYEIDDFDYNEYIENINLDFDKIYQEIEDIENQLKNLDNDN